MFKVGQLVCYKKYAGVYKITGASKEEVFEEIKGRSCEAKTRFSYTVQDVNDSCAYHYRAFQEEIGALKDIKRRSPVSESKPASAAVAASMDEEDWEPFFVFVTSFSRA